MRICGRESPNPHTEQLQNVTSYASVHTGKVIFKAYGRELSENFGNGEQDNYATFEDEAEERKVLELPVL